MPQRWWDLPSPVWGSFSGDVTTNPIIPNWHDPPVTLIWGNWLWNLCIHKSSFVNATYRKQRITHRHTQSHTCRWRPLQVTLCPNPLFPSNLPWFQAGRSVLGHQVNKDDLETWHNAISEGLESRSKAGSLGYFTMDISLDLVLFVWFQLREFDCPELLSRGLGHCFALLSAGKENHLIRNEFLEWGYKMAVVMKKKFMGGSWPLRSGPLVPTVPAFPAVEKRL